MDELQLKLCDIQGRLFELSAKKKIPSAAFAGVIVPVAIDIADPVQHFFLINLSCNGKIIPGRGKNFL